uniref:glycerophosphodiester phosphodiesterase n=1 Tax=Kalanchoe fedtschenkoi TaxID=63787 RepID=A0A7N1A7C1_KALFE
MIKFWLFLSLLIHLCPAQTSPAAPAPSTSGKWMTLDGSEPLVIARGGYSGIFPEGSQYANDFASGNSLPLSALYCNLQLTKDGIGFCLSGLRLENSTNIALVFPQGKKTYDVYGQSTEGWFAVDFTAAQIFQNVSLVQNIYTRPSAWDDMYSPSSVEDMASIKGNILWLNVDYDLFYNQRKQSPFGYIRSISRHQQIGYLSSSEIEFLKSMNGKTAKVTKLIFKFRNADEVEPTTKKTYGDIAKDLSSIASFVKGIMVPKEYIWPVDKSGYLAGTPSTIVADAHKLGLEVYASGFANDQLGSYNYSYDPTKEYLQFIDNSQFAVDGFLTDFPSTASESIACLAHNKNSTRKGGPLIITHNGASGVYPGCTDLAYEQAVSDGADIIDCSVQMSKDGVAFCLDTIDVTGDTNALATFMSKSTTVPEIQSNSGIFAFDLTGSEVQSLKPQLTSPVAQTSGLQRDPAHKNSGKFVTLAEFLELAKTKGATGVLINIENAAYLASKKGLDAVHAVSEALSNATLDKQSTQKVLIQSDDTSVLAHFQNVPTYQRVLLIKDKISNIEKPAVEEIKKYAHAINVLRASLITSSMSFTTAQTNVVEEMHAANISVYVHAFRNEYVLLPFDFFADPMVEVATYIAGLRVDGVVVDFPSTASAYLKSPCSDLNANLPYTILPPQIGGLMGILEPESQPPAAAPAPALEADDVVDPPLPAVSRVADEGSSATPGSATPAPAGTPPVSGAAAIASGMGVSVMVALLVLSTTSLRY